MAKKIKEKPTQSTNIDLDNEIIIGIKTLHEIEPKKKNKKKTTTKKSKNVKKAKATTKSKKGEFEFKLGIEDEEIKTKKKTPKKLTKKQEMAKKKRKAIFRLIKWTSLILILIGGGIYFLLSPFFNIKNIEIVGNQKLTNEEIISLSQVQKDENTFKLV